ncbi:MAG: hypothetical protein Q9191_002812 [Dirinaria sp. TL-2023a]
MRPPSPPKNGFTNIDGTSADIILSAAFNPSGNRIALASADHKIRVYDAGPDNAWTSLDQWRGHDGEVLDVRWIGPTLGQAFGTIGGDNKFKLWREDPSQPLNGGRRFRCIFSQSPSNHLPYVSLDIKTVKADAWVVLMAHDACLSLLEPTESGSLTAWKETDSIYPFGQQPRSAEPRYGLSLHQAERPCYDAVIAGLDANALSLAVSATHIIKVMRALKPDESGYRFYEMLEIVTDASLINDLAWAPGCIRPYDYIAAACDDGSVHLFEITTPHEGNSESGGLPRSSGSEVARAGIQATMSKNTPSGIGAGLAGASRAAARDSSGSARIKHEWKALAKLQPDNSGPVWKVRWMHDGSTLVSTGDSGKVHLWRQNIKGDFVEFAETGPS